MKVQSISFAQDNCRPGNPASNPRSSAQLRPVAIDRRTSLVTHVVTFFRPERSTSTTWVPFIKASCSRATASLTTSRKRLSLSLCDTAGVPWSLLGCSYFISYRGFYKFVSTPSWTVTFTAATPSELLLLLCCIFFVVLSVFALRNKPFSIKTICSLFCRSKILCDRLDNAEFCL